MKGFPAPSGAFFPGCRTAESPRGARPRAPTTHSSLHSPPYSLLNGSPLQSDHALLPQFLSLFPTSGSARRNRRAGRAHARQPRTTLSILLPTLYTTEAHCIVTTHYPLHSPPYPLPLTEAHCIVATHSPLHSPLYSLLCTISPSVPFSSGLAGGLSWERIEGRIS